MYKKYFILVVNLLKYRFWAVKNYRFAFRPPAGGRNKKDWLVPHSGTRCGACPPLEDNGEPRFAFAKGGD
jgi:hypothetical protein